MTKCTLGGDTGGGKVGTLDGHEGHGGTRGTLGAPNSVDEACGGDNTRGTRGNGHTESAELLYILDGSAEKFRGRDMEEVRGA